MRNPCTAGSCAVEGGGAPTVVLAACLLEGILQGISADWERASMRCVTPARICRARHVPGALARTKWTGMVEYRQLIGKTVLG